MKPSHGEWEMGSWCKPGWRKHQCTPKCSELDLRDLFVPFFPSINSLQVELNNIFMLRKQLEEDVVGNRNLQKILQDQIKDMKNHKGLYPCPAQPSSCTKEKWFYYSHFAGMEKKYLKVKKVWKDCFFFDFFYCRWFGGFVTECLGAIRAHTEGQFRFPCSKCLKFYGNSTAGIISCCLQLCTHTIYCFPQKSQICFPQKSQIPDLESVSGHGITFWPWGGIISQRACGSGTGNFLLTEVFPKKEKIPRSFDT